MSIKLEWDKFDGALKGVYVKGHQLIGHIGLTDNVRKGDQNLDQPQFSLSFQKAEKGCLHGFPQFAKNVEVTTQTLQAAGIAIEREGENNDNGVFAIHITNPRQIPAALRAIEFPENLVVEITNTYQRISAAYYAAIGELNPALYDGACSPEVRHEVAPPAIPNEVLEIVGGLRQAQP